MIERKDDYAQRRAALAGLTEEELYERFWTLARRIVEPLIELARTHTSPAIERAVLLRMGFSSQEAGAIVEKVLQHGLLGKGAGHVVWRLSEELRQDVRQTGRELAAGRHRELVDALFRAGSCRPARGGVK